MIRAKKLRPLAALTPEDLVIEGYGTVPFGDASGFPRWRPDPDLLRHLDPQVRPQGGRGDDEQGLEGEDRDLQGPEELCEPARPDRGALLWRGGHEEGRGRRS
ncbi:MAG: hypothetical protein MZV64_70785 [Ignavibacteriales bacterium]|nr:hypothetical protein [Ignavibacteriales bacterium]